MSQAADDDGRAPRPERFASSGSDLILPQCSYCLHRRAEGGVTACPAFPGGVPADVLRNRADHRKAIDGDAGVRFDPRPEVGEEPLRLLYNVLDNGGKYRPSWL